jgi:hypothetical protein
LAALDPLLPEEDAGVAAGAGEEEPSLAAGPDELSFEPDDEGPSEALAVLRLSVR